MTIKGEFQASPGQWVMVERAADKHCCASCLHDQESGYVEDFCDYCCCVHGELFGYRYEADEFGPARISWASDESEKAWSKAP